MNFQEFQQSIVTLHKVFVIINFKKFLCKKCLSILLKLFIIFNTYQNQTESTVGKCFQRICNEFLRKTQNEVFSMKTLQKVAMES